MRKYVPVEAIINLSETQKGALRDLWQPEQYDRIIIPICQDVERDLYSYEIYVIKDIVINAINQDKRFNTFRVPVHGYDYYQMFFEVAPVTDPAISEEFAQLDDDTIEDYDNDNTDDDVDSEIFFNKEECLPFLDISQLMAMIFSNQLTSNLSIERYDGVFRCLVAGEEFENENLCDLLWEAVKKML